MSHTFVGWGPAPRRAVGSAAISLLLVAGAQSAAAQALSAFAGRSVLEYDAGGDRAYGGWRLGLAAGPSEEIILQLSAARWGGLTAHDALASIRYGIITGRTAIVSLEAGAGTFRGPRYGAGERLGGRVILTGLNIVLVPVTPFGLELGGYYRDDGGASDLEGRIGLRYLARRPLPAQQQDRDPRISIGTMRYYRLGGLTRGDGLGVSVQAERRHGGVGGVVGVDIVPVRSGADNTLGYYDAGFITIWGGPRLRRGDGRSSSVFLTAGPALAAMMEGPLDGLHIGGAAEAGVELQKELGRVALFFTPSARLQLFDGAEGSGFESAIAWRAAIGLRF